MDFHVGLREDIAIQKKNKMAYRVVGDTLFKKLHSWLNVWGNSRKGFEVGNISVIGNLVIFAFKNHSS